MTTKLTGYQGSRPESATDVFVFLAADESKAVTGKMLSSSGWKSQLGKKWGGHFFLIGVAAS